ncbi:MAG: hypothetical protein J3K34DRAFT_470924 [Monoraphidium minutum]|nr:MAG: hypothetical protein J3K34DRAFT_470924 [Monoraphidium minutum]
MRRLLARRNAALLRDLRGRPARFWTGYKADGRATPGGAFTLEETGAHWAGVLGGAGREALEEGPAGSPAGLAAALGAAAERAGLDPARRAAAATLGAPIYKCCRARMRALVGAADQFALGAFVHACFERRTQSPP